MELKEAFDMLCKAAVDGTFPSRSEKGDCSYRGLNNSKCAAGIFIPDDKYKPDMEWYNIEHLLYYSCPYLKQYFPSELLTSYDKYDKSILRNIQVLHDELADNWDSEEFINCLKQMEIFKQFA